jgi:hypothetical protein
MDTFANKNLIALINEYTNTMGLGTEIMRTNQEIFIDAAVLTEAITMGNISLKCNHTSSQTPGSLSYERVPENLSTIVTQLDLMNLNMTTNTVGNVKTRTNDVSSAIACGIASLVEFANWIERENLDTATIVMTEILSVTHAALMTFVFRNFHVAENWDRSINLIMLTKADTSRGMDAYIGRRENVQIIPCVDPIMETYRILNSRRCENILLCTHSNEIVSMYTNSFMGGNIIINLVTYIDTIWRQDEIKRLITTINGIMEIVPCSDPKSRMVRITPSYRSREPGANKMRDLDENTNYFAKLRWYENMTRHMSLNGVCVDCYIMFKIARPIALALSDREINLDESKMVDPISAFNAVVSTVGMVDLDAA